MIRRNISANFKSFLRVQGLGVAVIIASWLIFWSVENPVRNIPNLFVYVLTQINLTVLLLFPLKFLYQDRWVRYRWPLHLISILAVNVVVVVTSAAVIYRIDGLSFPFSHFLRQSWKFPFVANLVFAFAYETSKITTRRLRRHNRQLQRWIEFETAERETDVAELKQARDIQRGLLPKQIPQVQGFQITGAWEPARLVGGDYYDVIPLAKNKVAICIADVAGKGISAALLMANVQAAIRAFSSGCVSPARVCEQTNAVLCTNTAADKFVTLFYGVLDASNCSLRYVNAGHPHPILFRNNGTVAHLEGGGALLGVFPDWKYQNAVVELQPGDLLLLFTDGITEAMRANGEEFGEDRMISAVLDSRPLSLSELQSQLLGQIKTFCHSRLTDDATLIFVAAGPHAFEKQHLNEGRRTSTGDRLECAGVSA
jgi:phosphoserine phosphatase RsbU/P